MPLLYKGTLPYAIISLKPPSLHSDAYKAQDSPFDLDELFKNLEADVFGDTEAQIMGQLSNQGGMDFDLSSIFDGGLNFGGNLIRNSHGQQEQQDEVLSLLKDFFPNS